MNMDDLLENMNNMQPKAPAPYFRAVYDELEGNHDSRFKTDDNGILRCRGYIKPMNESSNDECARCPFHIHPYDTFWED